MFENNFNDEPKKEYVESIMPKTDSNKKTVVIAIPHMGQITAGLETRITQWIMEGKYNVKQMFSCIKPTYANRNHIAQEFLKTDADYLLTIDSDTIPLKNPLNMIEHDKDIIGGVYPTWKNDAFIWLACKLREDGAYIQYPKEYRQGIKEVDALGTGCMLIKRKVLETISMPFVDKVREGVGDRELGHDLYFCKRAKELDFEVWADWDLECEHHKEINLLPLIRMFEKSNI
jgi:hypothetical protein